MPPVFIGAPYTTEVEETQQPVRREKKKCGGGEKSSVSCKEIIFPVPSSVQDEVFLTLLARDQDQGENNAVTYSIQGEFSFFSSYFLK